MHSVHGVDVMAPAGLSDERLLASIQSSCFGARRLDVQLLVMLGEIEERRLHLRLACSSIFDFCRRKLHMSEGEASRRMHASRLVRRLPALIPHIEAGRIHLTTLTMLRGFLTESNIDELVSATEGKTKDQVKELIAAWAPRPDVPARIRKLPDAKSNVAAASATSASSVESSAPEADPRDLLARAEPARSAPTPASLLPPRPAPGRIEPLAPARYKLEMTIGTVEREKLERVRELMRHRLPSGDLTAIFGAALDLLVAKLEKERLGATSRPRKTNTPSPARASTGAALRNARARALDQVDEPRDAKAAALDRSRHVPNDVRWAVFQRDGEQCAFRDAEGHRCPARGFLELDHEETFALGGEPTVENLRVRCRPHNQLHAEDTFGVPHVASRIKMRQRRGIPASRAELARSSAASRGARAGR